MSAENNNFPVSSEVPQFEDTVDFLEWVENNDTSALMVEENALSPQQLRAKMRAKKAEWKQKSPAERAKIRVGEEIRAQLLIRGLRQAEFARLLGKDRAWVTRLVQGRENLTIETLVQIAQVLESGLKIEFLPAENASAKVVKVVRNSRPSIAESKAPATINRAWAPVKIPGGRKPVELRTAKPPRPFSRFDPEFSSPHVNSEAQRRVGVA